MVIERMVENMKKLFWKLMALDAEMRIEKIYLLESIINKIFAASKLKMRLMSALARQSDKLISKHDRYWDRYVECRMPA